MRYDPSNPAANADGYVKLPNVNSLVEVMDMREAERSYNANLSVMQATRSMLTRTIDLLNEASRHGPRRLGIIDLECASAESREMSTIPTIVVTPSAAADAYGRVDRGDAGTGGAPAISAPRCNVPSRARSIPAMRPTRRPSRRSPAVAI